MFEGDNNVDFDSSDEESDGDLSVGDHDEMEKKLADDIKVGGFGACLTEDENYDYYLFKITKNSTKVKKDADLEVGDGSKVNVCEGDWICRGI